MKRRNAVISIISIITLLIATLLMSGCGDKAAITTEQFKSIAEENNCSTADATSQYAQYGVIDEATIALSSDGWQVEFYVLTDETNAAGMFDTNKEIFESLKGNASAEASSSTNNQSSYTLTSSGYYMHLCRVDNTLLYVKVDDTYKSDVKALIDELGY